MKRIIFCTLVLVMFFLNSVYLNAQIQKTLGMDGGFYFNSSNIAYHFSLTYSLQFNQYFGISAGTMFLSVPLDIAGWSDSSRNSSYYFDEDNIKRFNLFFLLFIHDHFSNLQVFTRIGRFHSNQFHMSIYH